MASTIACTLAVVSAKLIFSIGCSVFFDFLDFDLPCSFLLDFLEDYFDDSPLPYSTKLYGFCFVFDLLVEFVFYLSGFFASSFAFASA